MSLDELQENFDPKLDTNPGPVNDTLRHELRRDKRQTNYRVVRTTPFWAPSQVSLPKNSVSLSKASDSYLKGQSKDEHYYKYHYDLSTAVNTYVYMLGENGIWNDHPEFRGRSIEYLDSQHSFGPNSPPIAEYDHGSKVAAMVIGNRVGVCPTCTLVVVTTPFPSKKVPSWFHYPYEKMIAQLLDVLDDVKRKKRQGKATINMSFVYNWPNHPTPMFAMTFRHLLQKLDEQNVVIVAAAGNNARNPEVAEEGETEGIEVRRYPAKFADPNDQYGGLPNMIVVSASSPLGTRWEDSNFSSWVATFAPGEEVDCPGPDGTMTHNAGTSLSAPQVAALANYFRSVPSPWQSQLDKPSNVKKLIQLFARRFAVLGQSVEPSDLKPVIWNGQVGEHSCLRDYGSEEDWAKVCPTIQDNLEDEPPNPGETVEPCTAGSSSNPARRQSGGGSCPHVPGSRGPGKNINWEEGPSGPECAVDDHCGGELCKGCYCDPDPEIPHPPDYYDPKDPGNPHRQPTAPTSTTTGSPPTQTTEPPRGALDLCIGSSYWPTPQGLAAYAWSVYPPGSQCHGWYIVPNQLSSLPDACKAPNENFSFDMCDAKLTFINEGPGFFEGCGFQLEIAGHKYTPHRLDDDDDLCSGICGYASYSGRLLYEHLPDPNCGRSMSLLAGADESAGLDPSRNWAERIGW